jgi:hypothetical protein
MYPNLYSILYDMDGFEYSIDYKNLTIDFLKKIPEEYLLFSNIALLGIFVFFLLYRCVFFIFYRRNTCEKLPTEKDLEKDLCADKELLKIRVEILEKRVGNELLKRVEKLELCVLNELLKRVEKLELCVEKINNVYLSSTEEDDSKDEDYDPNKPLY